MAWQVQEAKQRFSELLRKAGAEGPQVVTRHGEEVAIVLSADAYRELTGRGPDLLEFLRAAPDLSALDLERTRDLPRDVDL